MEIVIKLLLKLSKYSWFQRVIGSMLANKFKDWLYLKLSPSGPNPFSSAAPTMPDQKRHYAPSTAPLRKMRVRASHNNRKVGHGGRGFRQQLIVVRDKKTGRFIEYRSIYHEN